MSELKCRSIWVWKDQFHYQHVATTKPEPHLLPVEYYLASDVDGRLDPPKAQAKCDPFAIAKATPTQSGSYTSVCLSCNRTMENADKRCFLCVDCDRRTPPPATVRVVAWRKPVGPQYDYTDRYHYREEHGIGAPNGWEPLYCAAPSPAPAAQSDNPNEGPIISGLVRISDGVLPVFYNQWKCAQCGRNPRDVQFNGCGSSPSCGRTATKISAQGEQS